jgi:hypothetical protein
LKTGKKPLVRALVLALAGATLGPAAQAAADERQSLEVLRQTTLNLIEALVEQGVFSREKADAMVRAAEAKAAAAVAAKPADKPATVRVQYVPESLKNEIREQIRQEVVAQARTERWGEPDAVPKWVDSIKWEGDLRLRYQLDRFDAHNAEPIDYILQSVTGYTTRAADFLGVTSGSPAPAANTRDDRNRLRLRARLGMQANISPAWSGGVRLSTGSSTDRVSTNQTLGQDWNKYSLLVDRAYLNYAPVPSVSITGGRMPNPWFSTDLVWDEDLNFDGIAATWKPGEANASLLPFVTVGAFPLKEDNPPATGGRWMSGVQAGAQWNIGPLTRLKLGAALYDFRKLEGQVEDNAAYLAGNAAYGQYEYGRSIRQKGNTLFRTNAHDDYNASSIWGLAARFRPANLTASLDLGHFAPAHVILTGDWVKNTRFDKAEILSRTGVDLTDAKDYGYQYKVVVGMPQIRESHDWQVSAVYRYLGSDAVVDGFTDSDFGLGGTNLKGYMLGLQYGIDRNTAVGLRWISADSISSFSLNPSHRYSVDVLQADVNVRF